MMSWGGRFVGRVEPPQKKLVFWSRLHRGLEGFLEVKTGLILNVSVTRGLVVPAAALKPHSLPNLPAAASTGPADESLHVCALLKALMLAYTQSVCVFVCVCLCVSLILCLPFFFPCVFPHALTLPCACANTIKASHPAALLNYTPRLLKRHPQIQPPCLPRSALLIPCGIHQRERITLERTHQVLAVHYSLNKEKKNRPCFVGLSFHSAREFLPIQNMIPETKWVCCVYGFERCLGISYARRRQHSRGKVGYHTDCSCFLVKW